MRPSSIPDKLLPETFVRITIGAPKGREEDILPVEAAVGISDAGPEIRLLIVLDPEDIMGIVEQVQRDEVPHFWYCQLGTALVPFRFDTEVVEVASSGESTPQNDLPSVPDLGTET